MRIFFTRHGESLANLTRTFSNRDPWHPLTTLGREQAEAMATNLAAAGITAIYCSPAVRALQTAEIAARVLGIEPVSSEALREFDVGTWEGTDSAEGWEEHARVLGLWANGVPDARVSNGESQTDVTRRIRGWIDETLLRHRDDARLLVVSHGGLYRAAFPQLFENSAVEWDMTRSLGHGEVVEAECSTGTFHIVRWGTPGPPPR